STHAGTLAADCASIATASNRVSTPPTTMSLFLDWYMAVTPAKHSQTVQANVNSFDWVPICVSILSKFSSGRNRQPMRLMQRNHQTHFARRGDLENLMGCKGSTTSIICHPLLMLTIFMLFRRYGPLLTKEHDAEQYRKRPNRAKAQSWGTAIRSNPDTSGATSEASIRIQRLPGERPTSGPHRAKGPDSSPISKALVPTF
ncbi:unnamed protein product, partial [Nesidiocoris tenuis]